MLGFLLVKHLDFIAAQDEFAAVLDGSRVIWWEISFGDSGLPNGMYNTRQSIERWSVRYHSSRTNT